MAAVEALRPKVLIVDDSRMIRVAAEKILRDEFTVIQAESGDVGWAEINADPEILTVFCDLARPGGLDGYGLLERIRQDEREIIAGLPVIIVTGDEESEARQRALDMGATDFIAKPFEAAQLLARARTNANADRLRRQLATLKASHTQDTMTGLGNARYFNVRLKSARAFSLRHHQPLAIVRIDLLNINEQARQRGRQAIANAMRAAGQILSRRIREEDVLVHLAPGRFAAICPACQGGYATRIGQRLLDDVLADGSEPVNAGLGASAAVHVPPLDGTMDLKTIHEAAQEAAKRARTGGRGNFVISLPDEEDEAASGHVAGAATPVPASRPATDGTGSNAAQPQVAEHLPQLLEQCARLFELAPLEVAQPILERLQARLQERQRGGQRSA